MVINHETVNHFLTKFFNSPFMKTKLKVIQIFDNEGHIQPLNFLISEGENKVLVTIPNSPYSEIMAKHHVDTNLIFTDEGIECNNFKGYIDYKKLVNQMNKAYLKYLTNLKSSQTSSLER